MEDQNLIKYKPHLVSALAPYNIADHKIDYIINHVSYKEIKKGNYFSTVNNVCKYIGLIIEGNFRSFTIGANGVEKTHKFYYHPVNIVITSYDSYYKGNNSYENIQALSDSKLLVISSIDMHIVLDELPELDRIVRDILAAELHRVNGVNQDREKYNNEEWLINQHKEAPYLFKKPFRTHLPTFSPMSRALCFELCSKLNI